ncbi:MAG: hypothetical protein ACI4NM_06230 [Bullifex sp.]
MNDEEERFDKAIDRIFQYRPQKKDMTDILFSKAMPDIQCFDEDEKPKGKRRSIKKRG